MLVVDLLCSQGHGFEGWFASADELASQRSRGLLSCPLCGDREVTRRPSAPYVNTSNLKAPASEAPARAAASASGGAASPGPAHAALDAQGQEAMAALQALYLRAVRHVVEHTEDVGARFVEEARSIHHGDAPARAIRGQATPQERAELAEEGIETLALPLPDALKGPLQ